MRDTVTRTFGGWQRSFSAFTAGQKVVAVVGTAALLLGGFMVFRWASAPSYSPLFSDLGSADASAVVEELDSQGVPYELTNGGSTVMVPQDAVYKTRIDLSGQGLPTSGDGGYSLLDDQGLSTSEFKEQTDFKRAMEGELSSTVEAIDGVNAAVVHLAIPQKDVFADEQQAPTASVLVETSPGSTLSPEQVQAVVHLVASSIDGLDPDDVTVADASGTVLSTPGGSTSADSTARTQQVAAVQDEMHDRLQAMLDRVVGPGNSTVQVTADLDFDKAVRQSTDYRADRDLPVMSESTSSEEYNGAGAGTGATGGVVGPDGQMDTTTGADGGADSSYVNRSSTVDNGVDVVKETRETAPGSVESMHVGVVLDTATTKLVPAADIRDLVTDTIGLDAQRGDSVRVLSLPFDRSTEEASAAELEAAAAAESTEARNDLIRKGGLVVLVLLIMIVAALRQRRQARKRADATTYVVEQLRQERAAVAPAPAPAALALEQNEHQEELQMRQELTALIERQPEDVAQLLRGWLTERA